MPNSKKKNKKRISQEIKKEFDQVGKSLKQAITKQDENVRKKDFLEETSEFIKDAIADWCIKIVGHGERMSDAHSEPGAYLYWLADAGAKIFSYYPKKNSEDFELLKIIQQLAALCFSYTPSLNVNAHFILERNYLISHNQTHHLSSYFLFLGNLLVEKNIEFTFRLTCLTGVLQFYTIYKEYLTNAFIEELFCFFNSSKAIDFFSEYKCHKKYKDNLSVYIPTYQLLVRQDKGFWRDTINDPDIEVWNACLKEEMTKAVRLENTFIKTNKLTHFSLFERESDKFIQLLLLSENDPCVKELKEEILLPTRVIREQIAAFTDRNHPSHEIFSTELLCLLGKKNKSKSQKLLQACEDEENIRIKCEKKKKQRMECDELEKKIQKAQLELKRKNESECKKLEEKKEKEFREIYILLNKLPSSLQRALKFISELDESAEKRNKFMQRFKAEFGKISSTLQLVCKLLNLRMEDFLFDIFNILIKIENKIKYDTKFEGKESNVLIQEIYKIKTVLEKEKEVVNSVIQKINELYNKVDSLSILHSDLWCDLSRKEKITEKVGKKLEIFSNKIKKLVDTIYYYNLILREYNQIFPLTIEQTTQLNALFFNIVALEKLSRQLDKEYEDNFITKKEAKNKTGIKLKAAFTIPNHIPNTLLFETSENAAKTQRPEVLPIQLLYEKCDASITDLKDKFFTTLAVIHLVSKITFNQGRSELAHIYREKLKTYKEKIQEEKTNLSSNEMNLDGIDADLKVRQEVAKRELQRLESCIDSLIFIVTTYGKGAKEFYQLEFRKEEFNRLLYFFKKELIPEAIRIELEHKEFLSKEEISKDDLYSQIKNLETNLRKNKLLANVFFSNADEINTIKEKNRELQALLDEKYRELVQINNNLQSNYIEAQQYNPSPYKGVQPILPLISIIPTVAVVPIIPIVHTTTFFQLPMPVMNASILEGITMLNNT